jgi:phosphoribosyl 1,2-cyclic phosphodiesterase
MSLFFSSLNSGSNGNCYYVGNSTEAVLVDAGLSCRETEKRMKRAGLEIEKVKAIFVSHEHGDHITGIPALSKKYQLPVYITEATLKGSKIPVEEHLIQSFEADKPVTIGELAITPFIKSHDAADPHSFLIAGNGVKVGVFTDIGYSCKRLIHYFSQCQAAFLESNYCEEMLMTGNYPYHLKKRISGEDGHLSNTQALELFIKYRSPSLSHLILAHLSKNNNSHRLVERLFNEKAGNTKITVASRYEETAVFSITASGSAIKHLTKDLTSKKKVSNQNQLSLF